MGHQPRKPPPRMSRNPTKTEVVVAHWRREYMHDEIDASTFSRKVDLAYDDPGAAYNEIRPSGSPAWPSVAWAPR